MNVKSQRLAVLAWLRSGRTLTPRQAFDLFGSNRLAARVWELREQGYPIKSVTVTTGNGARVAQYELVTEELAA